MQIVSEALFQRLRQKPILYTSSHNRIAYTTLTELIVREVTFSARNSHLKIKGIQVTAISLENSNFIVILFASGLVEVRRVELLSDLIIFAQVGLPREGVGRLRVSAECVYVLNRDCIEAIWLNKERGRKKIYLQGASKEQAQDLLISSIYDEQIILVQFRTSIAITSEGKNIAQAPFLHINTFKLLKDPLLDPESKEFLVVIESRRYLKVFDIFDLEPIVEIDIFLENNQEVELKVDPLNQYLMVRVFEPSSKMTKRNSLLKINGDFYKGSAKEPFFLFDIEVGLKHDFILFPTHIETIKGVQFYSIDMCFFGQKEIRIATLVIDVNHRSKHHNAKYVNSTWVSHSSWRDFFFQVRGEEPEGSIKQKQAEIKSKYPSNEEDWEGLLQKFYEQNLQKLKCEGFIRIHNKAVEEKKSLEYPVLKHQQDMLEYEDGLNTLSGSSSFGSLKEMPTKPSYKKQPFFEGDNFSSQQEYSKQKSEHISDNRSRQSQQSERDQYLKLIEEEILEPFVLIEQKIDLVHSKFDRFEHVHIRKLRNIQNNIRNHRKQVNMIGKNIEKWCGEEFKVFGSEIKETLKQYSSMFGKLQLIEIKGVKKLKKYYRDFLELQMQKCTERLEESEKHVSEIERIAHKQSQL